MDLEMLRERARIIAEVRSFFGRRNYLETDTPLLAPDLIPESCLEVFETSLLPPEGSRLERKPYWLIPSPEIWMKRLMARHRTSMFQICKCFRNGESSGRWHSPEFTMLEYYTAGAGYMESLKLTEDLFAELGASGDLSPPFIKITIEEAFRRWAGFDLYEAAYGGAASGNSAYRGAACGDSPAARKALEGEARRLGLNPTEGLSVHQLYDLIFIHVVEPNLAEERPVVLLDYPAFVPCLAKKKDGGKTVERWELYCRGVELANCFSEETGAEEVRRFFAEEKAKKEKGALVNHKVDDDYWKIFSGPEAFPPCSGVAMGLDRLIMVLCGKSSIDGVLPFP